MKKLFILTNILLIAFFAKAQYPTGRLYPVNQSIGADSTLVTSKGGLKGRLVNWSFVDTTAANLQAIKNYAGAQIFTTSNNSTWLRNNTATAWILQISNININSFLDSSVTNIHINPDSTGIIICTGGVVPVCDTFLFAIDSIVSVFMIDDSTAIGCQEPRTTCVNGVCTTEQICDTIHVNTNNPIFLFDNGLRKLSALNEWQFGAEDSSEFSSMLLHNTYFQNYYYWLQFVGKPNNHEVIGVRQSQWSQGSSSIMSWNHQGTNPYVAPPLVNPYNRVNLYLNYIAPMYKFGDAGGDSTGFMEDKTGYAFMTNARGSSYQYAIDNTSFKQTGVMFHFADTANTDAVTIFGQQVPASYPLSPTLDSNLYSKRIAVFHTDQSTNFLGEVYLTNGRFEPDTAQITAANDLTLGNGNVFLVSGNTQINAITTSGWQAGAAPIHLVFSGTPTVKNNTAGSAGTATILLAGRTDFTAAAGDVLSLLFDGTNWYETNRSLVSTTGGGYFNPNQTSTANTTHDANFKDFRVNNLKSFTQIAGVSPYTNAGTIYFDSTLVEFSVTGLSGVKLSSIDLTRDSIAIKPQGGAINIDSLRVGASTDSVMTWDAVTGRVRYRNASSFGISGITADNGLTASTATNVQLGGTLTKNTTIATGAFGLTISTATAAVVPLVVTATTGVGVSAQVTSGVGIQGYASTGIGIQGSSDGGTYGGKFQTYNAGTNNTVNPVLQLLALNGNAPSANGFGEKIDFELMTSDFGTSRVANSLISKLTTAADANYTSQFIITGVDSTLTDNLLAMGDKVDLTESTATVFATTTIPDGRTGGGEIIVTVSANDAIDFQARTLRFIWSAVNKGGTLTFNNSTPDESVSVSSGTLTAAITLVDAGSGVLQFKANAVSSLTQNVLRCSYQISKNF